jgi:membrane-associated protease RseP (regulator of RpoE activity)
VRDELYVPPPLEWSPNARPLFPPPAPRSRWKEYGRPALLFLVTAATVFLHGFVIWGPVEGAKLLAAVFSILLAHEMGHYLACRYYGVDATVPHFLPAPFIVTSLVNPPYLISLIGTFGAFIRIRGLMPHRKALFDIGVAGPIAGFLLCLPVMYLGIRDLSWVEKAPTVESAADDGGIVLNFPLAFRLALMVVPAPDAPEGMTGQLGPFGLAAWFGLFLTALNLIPVGQLDGGHATYALLRHRARLVSQIGSWVCVALIYFGPSWILWSILVRVLGRQHPTTLDEEAPVGRGRVWVGVLCLVIFVLCFVPDPIRWSWTDAWTEIRTSMSRWLPT